MTDPTYADAPESLIALWQKRRDALGFAPGEALPPLNCDLVALAQKSLAELPSDPAQKPSRNSQKITELQAELTGCSELALLNGLLIAHLRKRDFPAHAPALFHRIWREQAPHLLASLPSRWLISSLITFGDHGETAAEQGLGREMGMLFSLMKLYEFERLFSGLRPDQPFGFGKRAKAALPLDMPPFSLATGGLDINLLAPVWDRARQVPVAGPIACLLLERLNSDPGTLFRRISTMRDKRQTRLKHRKTAP